MELNQNDKERIFDKKAKGLITLDQANVEIVKAQRVRLVTNRLPAQIRKALNIAVKAGELGHFKKEGLKPETYYEPTFKYLAVSDRLQYKRDIENASKVVFA